jgi:hypothetical protein
MARHTFSWLEPIWAVCNLLCPSCRRCQGSLPAHRDRHEGLRRSAASPGGGAHLLLVGTQPHHYGCRPRRERFPAGRFHAVLRLERRITRHGISRSARSLPFTHPEWRRAHLRAPTLRRRRLAASGPQPDAARRRASITSPVTSQTPAAATALCSSFKRSVASGNNWRMKHEEPYSTMRA